MLKNILIITNTCIIVVRRLVHASMCVLLHVHGACVCLRCFLALRVCGIEALQREDVLGFRVRGDRVRSFEALQKGPKYPRLGSLGDRYVPVTLDGIGGLQHSFRSMLFAAQHKLAIDLLNLR
jgi:hypothetical protein